MSIIKKRLYLLYIAGIIILTFLVFLVGFEEVKEIISKVNPFHILYLAFFQLVTLFMTGYIWYRLLRKFCNSISLFSVLGVHLAGTFVENVTPSVKFGGETAKIYLMRQRTLLSYQELTAVTMVSKYFSLIPFLIISFLVVIYVIFAWDLSYIVYISFLSLVFIFALFTLFLKLDKIGNITGRIFKNNMQVFNKLNKITEFIKEASRFSMELTKSSDRWLLIFVASLVWILYPVKVYLVSYFLGFEISFGVLVLATYTAYLVSMIPLLPGGLGSFEGTMSLVFASAGLTSAAGLSIALTTRLITFWFPLFLSAVVTLLVVYKGKYKAIESN